MTSPTTHPVTVRPMSAGDVEVAFEVQRAALLDLAGRMGRPAWEMSTARGRARIAHLLASDPDSCWVHDNGHVEGVAVALVRDGMWFLSLLMVDPAAQGTGVGAALLEAALSTATDRSWITSTDDPAALRRYRRAGFALHPSYTAHGTLDRSLLPATPGVRTGSYDDDAELVDRVLRHCRGAGIHGDLAFAQTTGAQLLVCDEGFAMVRPGGIAWLVATSEQAGRELLVAAVAEAGDGVEVHWLTASQQWALEACLDLRLSLRAGANICLRGQQLRGAYLPNGVLG